MGDLPYISSEQGGLIIRTELIYELPYNYTMDRGYSVPLCYYARRGKVNRA